MAVVFVTAAEMPTGIGVALIDGKNGEPMRITRVFPGAGADKAGMKGQYYLISINGTNVVKSPLTNVMQALRGPAGSEVRIAVADTNRKSTNEFRIVRGQIKPPDFE